jgi:hypothetical protein
MWIFLEILAMHTVVAKQVYDTNYLVCEILRLNSPSFSLYVTILPFYTIHLIRNLSLRNESIGNYEVI